MRVRATSQAEYEGDAASSYLERRVGDPKWRREAVALAGLLGRASGQPLVVADVPVGTGRFLPLYEEQGHKAVGLDVSTDMLVQAPPSSAGRLALGGIEALPLRSRSVDCCVCVRLLNLIDRQSVELALLEMRRVTRRHVVAGVRTASTPSLVRQAARNVRKRANGGTVKVTFHSRSWWNKAVASAGFRVADREIITDSGPLGSRYEFALLEVD